MLAEDLVKQKFGRLTVARFVGRSESKKRIYECVCDCGNTVTIYAQDLKRNHTKSCGCLRIDTTTKLKLSHGLRHRAEYSNYSSMKNRVLNPKHQDFKYYGGRGITICAAWLESFANFFRDMGPKPSEKHSLDRYPDVDGNYEPGNVRWATPKEQVANRRKYGTNDQS